MNTFQFHYRGFSASIKGINGNIVKHGIMEQPIAESCILEVGKENTLKTWKTCVKKDNLDNLVLKDIPNLVAAIKNALDDDEPEISLTLAETSNGNLSMVLTFPGFFGSIPIEFCVEPVEQDDISILKQRVEFLTVGLRESKENEKIMQQECMETERKLLIKIEELKENEANERELFKKMVMQQQQESLQEMMQQKEILEKKMKLFEENEKIMQQQEGLLKEKMQQPEELLAKKKKEEMDERVILDSRKLVQCGRNLSTSTCGMLVVHNGCNGSWGSAAVGETMSDGVYFAEFMFFRMNSDSRYRWMCGVLPSIRNLNDHIYNSNGGFCFYAKDGKAYMPGSGSISTGLPACTETSRPVIIGVLLNLDNNKIQFFLNGVESNSLEIDRGEYNFAVSLNTLSDAVKLLSIRKQS